MIFWRSIKATEIVENEKNQLWNDYQTYVKVEGSDDLKQYLTLKEKVESIPFLEKKKEIESLRFKGSPEYHLLRKYDKLKNNKKLNRYFDLLSSSEYSRFKSIEKSGVLEHLSELERYIKNGQFTVDKKSFKKAKKADKDGKLIWEETETFKKKKEADELKSSPDVLFYNQFKKSRDYKNFLKVDGSAMLNQFEDITAELESDKFKKRKEYLEDLDRYEKTDDYKLLEEYHKLDADTAIQLYMKYNDTDKFKFFREWSSTFEEDFSKLDKKRWSFITPLAEQGPGKNFSIKNQLQYYNNADNFDTENGILTLETKHEQVEGLYWDEQYGFIPKTFNYASGIVHTVNAFMQEYGHFEIKLKTSKIKGVISSVSLVDNEEELAVKIFTSEGGNSYGGLVTTNQADKSIRKIKLRTPQRGYVIVSVTWTPERVEWYVNDTFMGAIADNIPHVPMGLRIETEVLKDTNSLPHRLDVDWIRCYKRI
jgi:hypothetical protein